MKKTFIIENWCMCEEIGMVARDMKSTCMQCGGIDAYRMSKDRPQVYRKKKIIIKKLKKD